MSIGLAILLIAVFCAAGFLAGAWYGGHRYLKHLDAAREQAQKFERYTELYDVWMMVKKYGKPLEAELLDRGFRRIAIYGMGMFGIRLYNELKGTGVEVLYGMARGPRFQTPGLTIYTEWDAKARPVDAVIVTPYFSYDKIASELAAAGYTNILAIDELLYRLI